MNYLKLSEKIIIRIFLLSLFFISANINIRAQSQPLDSGSVRTDTIQFQMQKSPWGAVLRSAVFPGLGQFYNDSYWKIPVIWGVLAYLGYQWDRNNTLYKRYRDDYSLSLLNNQTNSFAFKAREFYKDQRDLVAVFIGLTYFLNLVDAYVDAQLFDADIFKHSQIQQYQVSLKIKL